MSELNIVFPTHTTARVNGVAAEIHAVKLSNVHNLAAIAAPMMTLMADATPAEMLKFFTKYQHQLEQLLAGQTNLSPEQIASMDINQVLAWGMHILWANYDFFAQALPHIAASLPSGAQSSSDLSAPATT